MLRSSLLVRFRLAAIPRRCTLSSQRLTPQEREAALRDANEKMKAYYVNRPPIEVIQNAKKRSQKRDREHYIQALIVGSFLAGFILTPFLGKRIATDPEFQKLVPSWYNFSLERPQSAWTRRELHEQLVQVQHDLHERAIRGEFTPEKLEEMRRHFGSEHPLDAEAHDRGWDRLHPGVDDDEDIED